MLLLLPKIVVAVRIVYFECLGGKSGRSPESWRAVSYVSRAGLFSKLPRAGAIIVIFVI